MTAENVLYWYGQSSRTDRSTGAGWYPSAGADCRTLAGRYDLDPRRVTWAVAALSPNLKWEWNLRAAQLVIEGADRAPGAYGMNVAKAQRILWDAADWERHLSGQKVTSFARNMWGDPDSVTVDLWAWRIWSGADLRAKVPALTPALYQRIAEDYRAAAASAGIEPRVMQATTWVTIRRIANGRASAGQLTLDM